MSLLRILRNLAVLVILTVGGLALAPRPSTAVPLCPCAGSAGYSCGFARIGCHICKGKQGCRYYVCYDLRAQRCCVLSARKQCL
jgi:hypothetical protein